MNSLIINAYPTLSLFLDMHGIAHSPSYLLYGVVIGRIDTVVRELTISRIQCMIEDRQPEQRQYGRDITSLLELRNSALLSPFATTREAQGWLVNNNLDMPVHISLECLQQGTGSLEQMVSEAIDTTRLYLK